MVVEKTLHFAESDGLQQPVQSDILMHYSMDKSTYFATYQSYLDTREEIFKGREDKFVCLMDLALMAMRKLKKDGKLDDMEESDEINACSVVVPVEMDYGDHRESWY